jgi:glutathione S-transferase
MANIEYDSILLRRPPRSSTGKVPYVELTDGRRIADSGVIIETLTKERSITLDARLDDQQRARGHLVRRTLEESFYFCVLWERFTTSEGFAFVRRDYFRHAPWPVRVIAPLVVRRNVRRILHGHGTSRLSPSQILEHARADIGAVAATLGDRPFLLGDTPSSFDAVLTGFVWCASVIPYPSVMREAVVAHENLTAYLARMRERYWSGWEPN